MHYYQFHIGDYRAATSHLSNEEDLAYRRLLDMYYDTEQPIPLDIQWVSRRLRLGSEVVLSVLKDMFEETSEGYKNKRADDEIQAYHAYLQKQKANGKLGGRPKKTQAKPTANPEQTQPEPKKSLTTNHKPTTKEFISSADADFEKFWQVWPSSQRKVAKAKCLQVWKRKQLGKHVDQIIANVKALKASKQWVDGFDPAPLTYLNQDRWADEVVAESKTSALPAWAAEHYEARRKNEG